MNPRTTSSIVIATLCLLASGFAWADVAEDVMALARAQWRTQMDQASAAKQMETVADDYTEFNADYPTRIDGKALNSTMTEAFTKDSGKLLAADMVNPKVQLYGDVAILTYNFVGVAQDAAGATEAITAKSTRVYAKMGRQWKLVHANFAPLTNSPDN